MTITLLINSSLIATLDLFLFVNFALRNHFQHFLGQSFKIILLVFRGIDRNADMLLLIMNFLISLLSHLLDFFGLLGPEQLIYPILAV